MNKSRIEWTDYTWNPIKGLCPVGCWYCYARSIYRRFKLDPNPSLAVRELFSPISKKVPAGSRVFACSTFELFHPIADKWRNEVFHVIEDSPQYTFIILTKMPERIDRPMPGNVWLGTSIPKSADIGRWHKIREAKARVRFISFEPLMDDPGEFPLEGLDWAIVGRLTGHGRAHDPTRASVRRIYDACRAAGIPIFLKKNLADIWPGPLIQEFPRGR